MLKLLPYYQMYLISLLPLIKSSYTWQVNMEGHYLIQLIINKGEDSIAFHLVLYVFRR